jgi:hypothetical protein
LARKPDPISSFAAGMQDAAKRYRPDESELLQDFRISETDEAEVRGGSQRAHENPLNGGAQCWGSVRFKPAGGAEQWVAAFGDKMYYSTDEGASWTEIASGLLEDWWIFTTFDIGATTYLYGVNGDTTIKKWDGAIWTTIAGPGTGVTFIETHLDRLWCFGHNGLEVAACAATDDSEWTLAGGGIKFNAQTHDADALMGIFSFHRLMIFKSDTTGLSDGAGMDDLIVEIGQDGVSRSVGCVAPRTIIGAGDKGVCWLSNRGVEFYRPGGGITNLTRSIRTFMQSIAWSEIAENPNVPCAYWRPLLEEVVVALPSSTGQNDVRVVVNLRRLDEGLIGVTLWRNTPADGYTIYVNANGYAELQLDSSRELGRIEGGYLTIADPGEAGVYFQIVGDYLELATAGADTAAMFIADRAGEKDAPVEFGYDGYCRYADYGDRDDVLFDGSGGLDIAARMISRDLVFGAPNRLKKIEEIELLISSPEATTVTIAVRYDGNVGGDIDVTVPAATAGKTKIKRVKPKPYEALAHQVELRTTQARLRVAGVVPYAQVTEHLR